MFGHIPPRLILARVVVAQLPRGEMEAYRSHGEQTKAKELDRNTSEAKVLAQIDFILRIRVSRVGAGDEDSST